MFTAFLAKAEWVRLRLLRRWRNGTGINNQWFDVGLCLYDESTYRNTTLLSACPSAPMLMGGTVVCRTSLLMLLVENRLAVGENKSMSMVIVAFHRRL